MSTRRRARAAGLAGALLIGLTAAPGAATARPGPLRVGVGRADITPVTGAFKGGWACTCARATGQHERLYARVVVIRQGAQKVALVAEDLFALSAGMIRDAAALLPGLGFSEQNVIDSATHTHSSQAGYMNHPGDNLILPSTGNLTLSGLANLAADPVMYSFMTRQLAVAIRRADADLRPGAVGWGQTELLGVTMNRSLGAHLADFGITTAGANGGSISQDPGGYPDTIDPAVNVLRVDQYRGRQRVPVGMFSTFANHGTIDHANFSYYSGDHQGAAERVVEAAIRGAGHVPASQDVVNAFANSDAGDMTSGIQYVGPAAAEYIGRREAAAMLAAWRGAGRTMTNHPGLALRWTRVCFCGQQTSGGVTDSTPWVGKAAGAGSEEGRTIFYYLGLANEGDRLPIDLGPQGDKIPILNAKGTISQAVPLTVLRIGSGVIATVPGEPTVGVGKLIDAALRSLIEPAGIAHLMLVGYAGDYLNYFTTPAEYERQAYEGGFTMYGHYSSLVIRDGLVALAQRLLAGRAAPAPYPYDPNAGVHVISAGYGDGPSSAAAGAEPQATTRLGHASFSWTGGAIGVDRPVDRAFVTIQRRVAGRWARAADDLGMEILWSSDAAGHDAADWEVPVSAVPGAYRFLISGKRYSLSSATFTVGAGAILTPVVADGGVALRYPQPFLLNQWTYRPAGASAAAVTFLVDGRPVTVRERGVAPITIPAGASVTIPAGGARDAYGNSNRTPLRLR